MTVSGSTPPPRPKWPSGSVHDMGTTRVLAVGSCRVHRPLRRLADSGKITLTNPPSTTWFTHSSGEALQYIRALAGTVVVPEDFRPLICENASALPADLASSRALEADLVVIEVSTLKALRLRGLRLNYHSVWGEANRLGTDARKVLDGNTQDVPEGHVLHGLSAGRDSSGDVISDLESIATTVGAPLLAVDHLWAPMPDGSIAPERLAIAQTLSAIGTEPPIAYWSTRAVLERHGSAALRDHNHWSESHELVVGESIFDSVCSAVQLQPQTDRTT